MHSTNGSINLRVIGVPLLIWIGMIIAISIEAVVKFQAPSVTLKIGLDVGRQVFPALAMAEWILATITVLLVVFCKQQYRVRLIVIPLLLILGIVAVQNLWLLPALTQQATDLIEGRAYDPNGEHLIYVGLTFLKLIMLSWASKRSLFSEG